LIRIEDVAIGFAVSLVVGALFWPRGAVAALAQALSEAYVECAAYLRASVAWAAHRCDATPGLAGPVPPGGQALRAAAAARRLDDAFRGFLAERGTKHLALAEVAALITGVAGVRLTADAVLDLWQDCEDSPAVDRSAARAELVAAGERVADWYQAMAQALVAGDPVPSALAQDAGGDTRLIAAVRRDLVDQAEGGRALAVRIIWTGDHVDAVRRLQGNLEQPARRAATYRDRARSLLPLRRLVPVSALSRRPGPTGG
jgi:hypothetical protein